MKSSARVITTLGCLVFLIGCGGDSKAPKLATAGGSVTYKGSPIANATVTFYPDKGPLAMGVTDLNGDFKLNTGAMAGCVVGPAKVSVRVEAPGESTSSTSMPAPGSAGDITEQSKRMAEMTTSHQQGGAKSKSLIPDKYRDPNTSTLSYTVETDSSKNKFKIELVD